MSEVATVDTTDFTGLEIAGRPKLGAYLVLNPDFTIVGASDAYLQVTLLGRSEITGCNVFDVFPDNPSQQDVNSVSNLRASFDEVLRRGESAEMSVLRYDVRDCLSGSGRWVEKHWLPVNVPVFASGSSEIAYLIHHAQDVTEAVLLEEWIDEQALVVEEQLATLEDMKASLRARQSRLAAARIDLVRALDSPDSRTGIEEVRADIACPDLRRYFVPRDTVQVSGIYRVHHIRQCRTPTAWVHLTSGTRFPHCPSCKDCLLYSLNAAM